MQRNSGLTIILAVAGTVLVWFPVLAALGLTVIDFARRGRFLFDCLMPAELFPFAFVGGALLLWSAWRARLRLRLIIWGLAAITGLLVGGQVLAVLTGLASDAAEPPGWARVLVIAAMTGYTLALLLVCAAGVLLVRDLCRKDESSAAFGERSRNLEELQTQER